MTCSNCYNNCTEIKSDKCVRYTGADISALEIQNGDTLLSVEQKLIIYLLSALDGSGITPVIEPSDVCALVDGYLGAGTNLVDIVTALIKSICDLQTQVESVTTDMATLNADYDVDCLAGVSNSSDTHLVVQAIIDKLCTVVTDLQSLSADISTNYVALSDLNDLIQTYLDSASSSLMKNKMVPYTAIPYFGTDLSMFAADGSGTGDWIEIYLCNGANGTPDMRGRTPVGATSTPGVVPMSSVVDPNVAGNPAYTVGDVAHGANTITLSEAQMPQHSHASTASVTDPGHYHFEFNSEINGSVIDNSSYPVRSKNTQDNLEYQIEGSATTATVGKSSSAITGVTVAMTNPAAGSSEAHNNIQPSIGCYYIMFIPSV